MTYQLANSLPDLFAAVASAEGSTHLGFYTDNPGVSN